MVYWEKDMDYTTLTFKPFPRPQGYHTRIGSNGTYAACIAAFDIETTAIQELENSVMYIWQFCLDFDNGPDVVIFGRTWKEFKHMCFELQKRLKGLHLKVFIHNASYEFQFLTGIYKFKDTEVFCLESRTILYFSMYKLFDFTCSYKLFNMNLALATSKYAPDYAKKSGKQFNYSERRYFDTPLTRKELLYCLYDVWGLCKAVRGIMELFGDNLYSIPRTSTGYVRRELKNKMREGERRDYLRSLWPDYDLYKLLRVAFRGGNTHANRYYVDEIIKGAKCKDIASSYPTQQCLKRFPCSPFKKRVNMSITRMESRIDKGQALVIHARLYDVSLQDRFCPVPYLPIAKCIKYPVGVVNDNGRIVSCKECEICVTDIDYKIIVNMYKIGRFELLDLYSSKYDTLPHEIYDLNMEYYSKKTELKGIPGQELFYMKSKNLLNSIYGCSVQDPVKPLILFDDLRYTPSTEKQPIEILEAGGKNPYTVYQWGVWTTAHARDDLQRGIELCGNGLLYVDTDSCKYIGDADFTSFNTERRQLAEKHGAFAYDKKGIMRPMGIFEDDGEYLEFKTLGAKKYAYTDEKGLHITIAGVPKDSGAKELEKAGGLAAFNTGFVFCETGKLKAKYNDGTIKGIEVDGRKLDITNNTYLSDTTYNLGITADYSELIKNCAKLMKEVKDFRAKNQL